MANISSESDANMSFLWDQVDSLNSTVNSPLVLAIFWIICNDYTRWTISPLIISQFASDEFRHWHHEDLMQDVLTAFSREQNKIDGPTITILIEGDDHFEDNPKMDASNLIGAKPTLDPVYQKFYYKKENAIWFIDSYESFKRLKEDLMNDEFPYHRNGFFTMAYTGDKMDNLIVITKIFAELFQIYVTNVNILLTIEGIVNVMTYFPFRENRCHSTVPDNILQFPKYGEVPKDTKFFPKKFKNMYGCPLVVTTRNQDPFIKLDIDKETGELKRLHGIEGSVMSLMAERMNFSIKLYSPGHLGSGDVLPNKTATGALSLVVDGHSNFTLNAFMYDKGRADVALAAFSYMSCNLAIAIPRGIQMSAFERLVKPFKYKIWIILTCSILTAIVIIFSLKIWSRSLVQSFIMGYGNRIPFTNLLITFLGGPVFSNMPGRNFSRFLLMSWILYTFILRSAYVSELFYILQDGRAISSFSTIGQLVKENYTFLAPPLIARMLKSALNTDNIEHINIDNNTTLSIMNSLQSSNNHSVLVIFKEVIIAYNQRTAHERATIAILPEILLTSPVTLYMRKHSYMKHYVDELLQYITSSGIVNRFEKYYINEYAKFDDEHEPIALTLPLLWGCFGTYLILLFVCFMVLIFEILSLHSPFIENIFSYINL